MGSIAASNSAPLRRSGRATLSQVPRSMTTSTIRAALIQDSESTGLIATKVEEMRAETHSEEVGPVRRRKRSIGSTAAAAVGSAQDDVGDKLAKPKKRRKASKKEVVTEAAKEVIGKAEDEPATIAAPKKKRKRASKTEAVELEDAADGTASEPLKKRKTKAKKSAATVSVDVVGNVDEFGELLEGAPVKVKRKRKVKEEPVYIIPDVEKKTTTFKGRLGYACLNTVLRNKKPAAESVFCSRTCRIDSIKKNGMEWVKDLGRKNVQDLLTMIQWNEDNNIRFMRLSSEMFPFASHPKYGYTLEYCSDLLAQAGALAKRYGHRLTVHPGQFTQLGSNKPAVIDSAIRELEYHCQMLDLMGVGPDGVMIVHGGGMYEDKEATIARIKDTISRRLPANVRARLVLENDEMCYNAEELLGICEELDVPLVFDYHHDMINPSSIPPATIIARANAIFTKRGIKPKQHLSEQRPGAVTVMERRAHADRCEALPLDLPDDMDLMIEAKDKEQAVLHLYRMYDLQPVKHESLRPPATNQIKETKGRKSTKPAKGAQSPTKKKGKSKAAAGDEESSDEGPGNDEQVLEGGGADESDAQLKNMEDEPEFVDVEQSAQFELATPAPRTRRTRGKARAALS